MVERVWVSLTPVPLQGELRAGEILLFIQQASIVEYIINN